MIRRGPKNLDPRPGAPALVGHRLRSIAARLGRLRRRASSLEEGLDAVHMEVDVLASKWNAEESTGGDLGANALGESLGHGAGISTAQPRFGAEELLRKAASGGVRSLRIEWSSGGGATVQVDDFSHFHLSPQLAALLHALSLDSDDKLSSLVGWKSKQRIAELMTSRLPRPIEAEYVVKLVYSLRRRFREVGLNDYLIQSDRQLGYRFALRREANMAMEGES